MHATVALLLCYRSFIFGNIYAICMNGINQICVPRMMWIHNMQAVVCRLGV